MSESTGEHDGRRLRGERRRAAIIAATLRVIEQQGIAGVTHRAVAREADVPASSALYYFATLDDLLVAALTAAVDDYVRQLRELVDAGEDPVDSLARMIAEAGGSGRSRALAERELTLLAARRPALRPVARRWRDEVIRVGRRYADPMSAEQLMAASDGLCARILLNGESLSAQEISAALRHALRLD